MAVLKELVVQGDASIVGTLNATAEKANNICVAGTLGSNVTGKVTISNASPSGGSNGDIWFKYS